MGWDAYAVRPEVDPRTSDEEYLSPEILEVEALRFHPRSDDHEIFLREAAIVEEHVLARREKRPRRENLRESVLSKCGERMAYRSAALVERVRAFYREFEKA